MQFPLRRLSFGRIWVCLRSFPQCLWTPIWKPHFSLHLPPLHVPRNQWTLVYLNSCHLFGTCTHRFFSFDCGFSSSRYSSTSCSISSNYDCFCSVISPSASYPCPLPNFSSSPSSSGVLSISFRSLFEHCASSCYYGSASAACPSSRRGNE